MVQDDHQGPEATCSACGAAFRLDKLDQFGTTKEERSQQALECSKANGIDLASAYSVLLGLMSIEQARAASPKASSPVSSPRSASCDPGFRQAVAEGHLTLLQATERGDRLAYASRLAHRHGLSMDAAILVTDNRIALAKALKLAQETKKPASVSTTVPASSRWYLLIVVAALIIGAYWTSAHRHESSEVRRDREVEPVREAPASIVPVFQVSTSIRTDPKGRPTEVIASTPRAVLEAYCRSLPGGAEPIRTVPSGDAWAGIYRRGGGTLYSIAIRKDPKRSGWFAGDGSGPINETMPR